MTGSDRSMTRRGAACLVLTASVTLAGCGGGGSGPGTATGEGLALVGGMLVDGTGNPPVQNSVVLIRGQRIERVGTLGTVTIPEAYAQVSTEGMTVLPGLWDPHVHLLYNGHPDFGYWFEQYSAQFGQVTIPASAEQVLMAGVTSVRDLGAPLEDILSVRERIASGDLPGPTIYTAGPILQPTESPGRTHILVVSDPADAVARTRELIEAGVDIIKIAGAEGMAPETIRAIVAEAHNYGLMVTAHGRTDAEVRLALDAGVDELQHIGTGSREYPADIVASIRRRVEAGPPLYWSPTVGTQFDAALLAADREFLDDPRAFEGLPPMMAEDVRQAVAAYQPSAPDAETTSTLRRKIAQLEELGVIFVFGSDMGTFGAPASEATWREMDVWVRELGIPPLRVIQMATGDAARLMRAERDSGTISQGKYADVIAVRGNPLRHMDVLRAPSVIIKHGQRYR